MTASTSSNSVVASAVPGFARAAQPVSAATRTTSADGLAASDVVLPTDAGELPAYVARPKPGKSFPRVLVVQEIFGLHEHIKDICRRLAQRGHVAIAPDQGMALASVEQMRAALSAAAASPAARRSEIEVYPEAGHAFYADYRPSFRQAEADDGWRRMLDWFEANGAA